MFPTDSLPATPRGPLSSEAARIAATLRAPAPTVPFRADAARPDAPRPSAARAEVLVFALRGMRFALPATDVIETMAVAGDRWSRLLAMSNAGTLGTSGLPLIRLSDRMGLAGEPRPTQGALVLLGSGGKVRAAVLVDGEPERQRAVVESMPASWRDRFSPCEDMIEGVALLADGTQAAVIDVPLGIAKPGARAAAPAGPDTAHLLVRAGRAQLEAVRIATISAVTPLDEVPGIAVLPSSGRRQRRMLVAFGGEGEVIAVDEIVGLAPQGRIERVGGMRFLAAPTGRYRLLEPAGTQCARATAMRVLVTAPEGAARAALRDLVRSMGHDVSLADDPRAARLAGGRFDVILFDLDAYADVRDDGVTANDPARRIALADGPPPATPRGFSAAVPKGDTVALVLALLQRGVPTH